LHGSGEPQALKEEYSRLAILLDRCRHGDELAWEALVREYQSRVYGLAYHYSGNPEDARDIAQTAFIKIYRQLDSCVGARHFLPWMICVTRNTSIDHLRRRNARPPTQDVSADGLGGLPDRGTTPEEITLALSRKELLYRALRALTELNREIILLREIQELTLEEVASMLRVPLGTIKSRLPRARLELAEKVLTLSAESERTVGR